jgi:heptosyltransferase I
VNERLQKDFRNILIIKPSSLGDVVRCLPILSGLRRHYPAARISWLVRPDCAAVLRNNPDLDEIIEFERHRFGRIGRDWQVTRDFFAFLNALHRRRFDLVLDAQGLFRSGFIAFGCGAPVRLGFAHARELGAFFYTDRIRVAPEREHIVDSCWRFATALGFGHLEKRFFLAADPVAEQNIRSLLAQNALPSEKPYFVMLAGGTEPAKRWPARHFATLALSLARRYDNRMVLAGAGATEQALAQDIARHADGATVDLTGRTSLAELIALLRGARLIVGNDSGPLHIAAALDRPVVSLYGPTDPAVVGPYGQMDGVVEAGPGCPRKKRYSKNAEHDMTRITVDMVLAAIERKLNPT